MQINAPFPAGAAYAGPPSGTPKIRAIQIIAELEGIARGLLLRGF